MPIQLGTAIRVSSDSSWESERHRRGSIRWYPFDVALPTGLASAGSTSTLTTPGLSLFSGALTATPQSKGREIGEKNNTTAGSDIFTGIDLKNYLGRPMRATVFMGISTINVTPIGGHAYAGLFLRAPGIPVWAVNPAVPFCLLCYARDSVSDPGGINERWELHTAIGNGTARLVTQLAGVDGPKTPLTSQRTQRLEIVYKPDEYIEALIDGKVGARHTTNLPDVANIPAGATILGGCGIWLEQGNLNDAGRADFHSLMLEHYRA